MSDNEEITSESEDEFFEDMDYEGSMEGEGRGPVESDDEPSEDANEKRRREAKAMLAEILATEGKDALASTLQKEAALMTGRATKALTPVLADTEYSHSFARYP
ncbi:hypothetical protein KIPB_008001 [Kipferlia bialata]|uniref:Uncharacterized protein n=1 Tax=Kipferlia bialata TaxID=797122 RepID=A0A9K3D0X5_9EUKA|nr:hypothetical protein KIPB_008001 [Kipferlia bialata]|eukprot:g8001.t1